MKIRYNPFKLYGPWIGLVLGLILAKLQLIVRYTGYLDLPLLFSCGNPPPGSTGICYAAAFKTNMIYIPFFYFLYGWAISIGISMLKGFIANRKKTK